MQNYGPDEKNEFGMKDMTLEELRAIALGKARPLKKKMV